MLVLRITWCEQQMDGLLSCLGGPLFPTFDLLLRNPSRAVQCLVGKKEKTEEWVIGKKENSGKWDNVFVKFR